MDWIRVLTCSSGVACLAKTVEFLCHPQQSDVAEHLMPGLTLVCTETCARLVSICCDACGDPICVFFFHGIASLLANPMFFPWQSPAGVVSFLVGRSHPRDIPYVALPYIGQSICITST